MSLQKQFVLWDETQDRKHSNSMGCCAVMLFVLFLVFPSFGKLGGIMRKETVHGRVWINFRSVFS